MDHLGFDKFMVLGFCIGGPLIWNLLKRAPDRVVAGVLAMPSGSRPEMRDLFYDNNMKGWAPELIKRRPDITMEQAEKFLTRMYRTNPGFRLHGHARFRPPVPDAGADPARRYPRAPLRGCHGERAAGAECGSQPVSVEGAERSGAAGGTSDPIIPTRTPAGVGLGRGTGPSNLGACHRHRKGLAVPQPVTATFAFVLEVFFTSSSRYRLS